MAGAFERLFEQTAERERALCEQANRVMSGLIELEAAFQQILEHTGCAPCALVPVPRLAAARIAVQLLAAETDFHESLRDYCRRRGRDFDARGEFVTILAIHVFKPH